MFKINDKTFKSLIDSGEYKFKNGNWYRKTIRIKWDRYITLQCPECNEFFITRHEDKCCSRSCGKKYHWKLRPIEKRFKFAGYALQNGYKYFRDGKGIRMAEHRYVMEKVIGRKLSKEEHVHHINGKKTDNRPQNLMILSASGHNVIHKPEQSKEWKRNILGKFIKKHVPQPHS